MPGAADLLTNVLASVTEQAIVARDLEGRTVLWNEGARRSSNMTPPGFPARPTPGRLLRDWRERYDLPFQLASARGRTRQAGRPCRHRAQGGRHVL